MKSVLLIPVYNLSGVLLNLVESLIDKFTKIIIINDGSILNESKKILKELQHHSQIILLDHKINFGMFGKKCLPSL